LPELQSPYGLLPFRQPSLCEIVLFKPFFGLDNGEYLSSLVDDLSDMVEVTPGIWGGKFSKEEKCCDHSEGILYKYDKTTYYIRVGLSVAAKLDVTKTYFGQSGKCPPSAGTYYKTGIGAKLGPASVGGSETKGPGTFTKECSGGISGIPIKLSVGGGVSDGKATATLCCKLGKGGLGASANVHVIKIGEPREAGCCRKD